MPRGEKSGGPKHRTSTTLSPADPAAPKTGAALAFRLTPDEERRLSAVLGGKTDSRSRNQFARETFLAGLEQAEFRADAPHD